MNPGGLQTERWPERKGKERRARVEQGDGGPLVSADALALYQNLKIQAGTQS